MTEPIRLGMVGGGPGAMIGPTHRIAARMYGRYRLVAGAFSRTPGRNRAMGEELALRPDRVYADYREMARAESARDDGIEAVAVVTPNDSHVPISMCFLRHGIHVICDKPLAIHRSLRRVGSGRRGVGERIGAPLRSGDRRRENEVAGLGDRPNALVPAPRFGTSSTRHPSTLLYRCVH